VRAARPEHDMPRCLRGIFLSRRLRCCRTTRETPLAGRKRAMRTRRHRKQDFPVGEIRRFLEPGPVVLVSCAHKGETNIMTMGWHMVMEFSPSPVACMIAGGNHSHRLIRDSGECVINVPTVDLADTV